MIKNNKKIKVSLLTKIDECSKFFKKNFEKIKNKKIKKYVKIVGWVKNNRCGKNVGFIDLSDGISFNIIQCVYIKKILKNFNSISKLNIGSSIEIIGYLVNSLNKKKQLFEVKINKINIINNYNINCPIQKKKHSLIFLRKLSHLRMRTNLFSTIFKIKSILYFAVHLYFNKNNFISIQTPIITNNNAENSAETFKIIQKNKSFFNNKKVNLTVSGQLHLETFISVFRKVYTFGPTFRAENSNTQKHASEFWMIESEIAFANLSKIIKEIEKLIKFCIKYILLNAKKELFFLSKYINKDLIKKLKNCLIKKFKIITYTNAIKILKKKKYFFKDKKIKWGANLSTENEKCLCEKIFKCPVFVINYPKNIKSFYMRINSDKKTVSACDLLMPGIGEMVGGSQREERLDYLIKRIKELNLNEKKLSWYIDLRKYGSIKHSGFGIGFERFLMFITSIKNIRDVIPFAVTPNDIKF